jgi:hypothetical protein
MSKYNIIYAEVKKKREERFTIILEAKNIKDLYNQLEKSNINQIIDIKEI